MRVPLSWLKDWVNLPLDLKEVKETLFRAGVELEAEETQGSQFEKVVVARVEERNPHPNADRLSLCKVFDGKNTYSIVCGAQNFQAGSVVPLALEGAILPGNFKIKRSKIRGVESEGMLCSAKELGLAGDAEGLMLLDPKLALGAPLKEALNLGETILTLQMTANRPDQNSILGLARELSALTGQALRWPAFSLRESGSSAFEAAKLVVDDKQGCPLYAARIIRGVKIGPSPQWLVKKLEACGSRGINNIVDVTNLVLFELGQPLHAFDLAKLGGRMIKVRRASEGEPLVTLDGKEHKLSAFHLVIADEKVPVALAGVMGGRDSEVGNDTRDILLESAFFDPSTVRRGAKALGIATEASYRFERGVDSSLTLKALDRAAALMAEIAGGLVAPDILKAGEALALPEPVTLRLGRLNQLLGTGFSAPEMALHLQKRAFEVKTVAAEELLVRPPSYRREIKHEADLAEEVAQMAGFAKIPSRLPASSRAPQPDDETWTSLFFLRDACLRLGLREASTLSFLDPARAAQWGLKEKCPRLDNPLSEDQSLLRASLLPNLIDCVAGNLNRQVPGAAFFEVGTAFENTAKGPEMKNCLAMALCGASSEKTWNQNPKVYDFFSLKAFAEGLGLALGAAPKFSSAPENVPSWLHPGQAVEIRISNLKGHLGALHPALEKALGLKSKAFVLEIILPAKGGLSREIKYQAFSRFPVVERDLSCLVPENMEAAALMEYFGKQGVLKTAQVDVLDVYRDAKLPEGKKSLTFAFQYQAVDRTLTDDEVNKMHESLSTELEKALPVIVRRG